MSLRPDNPLIVQSDRSLMLHTVRAVMDGKGRPRKDADGSPLTEEHPRFAEARDALARVVDIEGSGPRDPGAAMAVNQDGEVAGSVSGGCVEGAVVGEALQLLDGDRPAGITTFGYSDDEAFAVGLTCGGTIHLFIEELDW